MSIVKNLRKQKTATITKELINDTLEVLNVPYIRMIIALQCTVIFISEEESAL